ncbi:MAG: hypothetical protein K6T65_10445 [Peptococcaceae bacterium]|nr:hypothetical protein [Peptococcaceae bacterium]
MYVRFPIIADLCGYVLGLSKTELCNKLGIAIPTLTAYRSHQRYPREGEASHISQAVGDLLRATSKKLQIPFQTHDYVMSSMALNELLTAWARNPYFKFQMSILAADLTYTFFTSDDVVSDSEKDNNITPEQFLTYLLKHDIYELPKLISWIIKEYCNKIDLYSVNPAYSRDFFWTSDPLLYRNISNGIFFRSIPPLILRYHTTNFYIEKYKLYEKLKNSDKDERGRDKYENTWVGIPFPFNLDVIMLTMKEVKFILKTLDPPEPSEYKFQEQYQGRMIYPVLKFIDLKDRDYTLIGHKPISYYF